MNTTLLLAALLLQETPEATLKKIQETVAQAKTLQADYAVQGLPGGGKATGTIQLKQGNKVRIDRSLAANGEVHESETCSDGKTFYRFTDRRSGSGTEPSKNLDLQVRALFGVMSFLTFMVDPPDSADPKTLDRISDLKAGADDGALKTLEYTWALEFPGAIAMKARLWYDPKTSLVAKRTLTTPTNEVITETFSKVVLNGEIPDETFQFIIDKKK